VVLSARRRAASDADRVAAGGTPIVTAPRCAVCGTTEARPFWGSLLVQCVRCSLVRAADRFFSIDPERLYDADYFTGAEYVDYRGDRRATEKNARRRIRILRRLAPTAHTLFEIGSAYGYFLEAAGGSWSSSGIEVSAHATREAERNGIRCTRGDYTSAAAPNPAPDIVCMWDTIEHLADPRGALEKVAAEIAPGGLVAISTADIGTWLPRLQRARWRQIHPPTHLWYFSAVTLTTLLQQVGLRVLRVIHPAFYRSLRLYVPQLALGLPTWVGDLPVPLQTWDLVEVYAVRSAMPAGGRGTLG
jgi:SAM-dependent methyltransferase